VGNIVTVKNPDPALVSSDQWIKLAELTQKSYLDRRILEWRLSFAVWTTILAFTAVFFTDKFNVKSIDLATIAPRIRIAYGLLLFILAWIHWSIQYGHRGDRYYYLYYIDKARLKDSPEPIKDSPMVAFACTLKLLLSKGKSLSKKSKNTQGYTCTDWKRDMQTYRHFWDITWRWWVFHLAITMFLEFVSYTAITELVRSQSTS
jgi:hypothetical protein